MVTGENLSSGLAKTGSAPHGFHAALSAAGRCRLYAITNSSDSMSRRPCGTSTASASFIAAARACRMTARNSAKSSHRSLKSERLSLRRTVSLTRYRPPDKARRRLARNLAQSPPASLQAAAGEISSARYRSAASLWIARWLLTKSSAPTRQQLPRRSLKRPLTSARRRQRTSVEVQGLRRLRPGRARS
jgi:hypothetical protein